MHFTAARPPRRCRRHLAWLDAGNVETSQNIVDALCGALRFLAPV